MPGTVFDVAIVGAGIAGAGLAAELAGDMRVLLLEAEDRPGYHTTGRSAAIFIQNYGNAAIRALSRVSAPLFDQSGAQTPILSPRGLLFVADEDGLDSHAGLLAEAEGMAAVSSDEALRLFPLLRPERIAAAAYEPDAMDIDVAALHQAFLKRAKAGGADIVTGARVVTARRQDGLWAIGTSAGAFDASIIVNAAGAWADAVATACGVPPLGIQPLRRSIAVLPAPEGVDPRHWPLVCDSADGWYARPEAGRLLVSPCDEDPVEPHDAFADDMVLAEGLYRFEQAVDWPVTRVERSWAGLRSFAPDRTPVAGFDPAAEGFFWLAGQGGYGIQTVPALSRFASAAIRRADPPDGLADLAAALSPARFRT
jgi:D-arginine dehydrogenase